MRVLFLLLFFSGILFAQRVERLGPAVNSDEVSDYYPMVSPSGKQLYFIRLGHKDNLGSFDEDIWMSKRGTSGEWTPAVNIDRPLNNEGDNGVISISADENTLYIANTYKEDGSFAGGGLSYSERTTDGWSLPKKIIIRQFYNQSQQLQNFCFSPSRKQLFMSLKRRDSKGGVDLYVAFREGEGLYGPPVNLGNAINTPENEFSPFIAADNKTLFFSSTRAGGIGKADIYVSKRLDDSWKNWTTPKNLGRPINSSGFDAFYTVAASGDFAYFASKTAKGYDLYQVALGEDDYKPEPTVLVSGVVRNNQNGDPLSAEIRYFDLETSEEIGLARSSGVDGKYQVLLPSGRSYSFRAEKEGFFPISENLDLRNTSKYEERKRDLGLAPAEVGSEIRLNNLFFETGKADLSDNSRLELEKLVSFLNENPAMRIEINGHTDNVGSESTNQKLSEERARAVVVYLLTKEITPDRLSSRGFGENRPVSSNATASGRAQNRRVTFKIL
jgi:OOP family OmpA-OmpF porin